MMQHVITLTLRDNAHGDGVNETVTYEVSATTHDSRLPVILGKQIARMIVDAIEKEQDVEEFHIVKMAEHHGRGSDADGA